jgi:hypothetical protein
LTSAELCEDFYYWVENIWIWAGYGLEKERKRELA